MRIVNRVDMGFESRKQTSRAGNLRLLAGCAAQWFKGGEGCKASGSRSRAGACQGVRIRAGGSGPRGRYQALTGAGGLLTPHAVTIAPS